MADDVTRLSGITLAKQFPSQAEPVRGLFTLEQVRATAPWVQWRVIAPIGWIPRWLAERTGKPYVKGSDTVGGIPVDRPRYPVLPRRLFYTTVAPAVAFSASRAFGSAVRGGARFVHAHAIYPSAAAARRLARKHRLPLVVSVHGSDLYTNLVRPAWAREVRATLAAADAIVCVSESLAHDTIALGGADAQRVRVIPNTFDTTRFTYVPRAEHCGPVRFVSVGKLVPVKGHDILVRAFASALRAGLDATLTIVGEGPERQRLRELIASEAVADRVTLAGALDGPELVRALHEADAFVLASRKEGFGVAIIEAMATGLPVIATRSGGPADIVDEACGVLVDPDDVTGLAEALRELGDGRGSFDREAIARRVTREYSPQRVGAALAEVYRAVVAGTGHRSDPGVDSRD